MPHRLEAAFPAVVPPRIPLNTKDAPAPPTLPSSWQCTALLHPFSPPPSQGPAEDVPFFQLCVATIGYVEGKLLSAQLSAVDGSGTWWYKVTSEGTTLSTDEGATWHTADTGWTLPTPSWLSSDATWFAKAPLNWLSGQEYDWWKEPAATPITGSTPTTWMWFNEAGLPFRMMFGGPPPTPYKGRPQHLALFQNFSFTYFPSFEATSTPITDRWSPPEIPGFQAGNPEDYQLVVWRPSLVMTTLMTPVDAKSFPLPTAVFYEWKPDDQYRVLTDRGQNTLMWYLFNPQSSIEVQEALLFGVAPKGMTPPKNAGSGYLINDPKKGTLSCKSMSLGEEPPGWARIPAVDGDIHAVVTDNPALCPENVVTIISVLFPPTKEYPDGRYLWTWYSPFPGSNGTHSRPVTFMESASNIAEGGTSLALADYFSYSEDLPEIPPDVFTIPSACDGKGARKASTG